MQVLKPKQVEKLVRVIGNILNPILKINIKEKVLKSTKSKKQKEKKKAGK